MNFSIFWRAAFALLFCLYIPALSAQDSAPAVPAQAAAEAHWLSRDMIAWNAPKGSDLILLSDGEAAAPLVAAGQVDGDLAAAYPHLRGISLWRIHDGSRDRVRRWLKGRVDIRAQDDAAQELQRTSLQIGGVLDDLYANDAALGARFDGAKLHIALWAPTAQAVKLHLFDGPGDAARAVLPMTEDAATGVWHLDGAADWKGKYYLYEVRVFVPETGRVETNMVTDPYALSLSADSKRTHIADLNDPALMPAGWDKMRRALPEAPEDRVLYELHVRDFSISDASVAEEHRGGYLAFTDAAGNGMRHLRSLAEAGLSDVHLLPTYDCATIPETPAERLSPPDLSGFAPNSEQQQAEIAKVKERDGFNWCYDPLHYMTPEGSYSSDADAAARILEFRRMVMALSDAGLGTIVDVVFNHMMASGQAPLSVVDRIVPGYYHRLDDKGAVARSTCCANTATERRMMEKLMIDALTVWARDYKVSGFRFDLMGHHSRENILKARDTLRRLTLQQDGVDGRNLYLYGEGWNFGEVANNARFVQASQMNMGQGTGIGTFNDRIRDAIRGGGVGDKGSDSVRKQGFANGLFTAPNAMNKADDAARKEALRIADHIRVGLAGSIGDFTFTTADGMVRKAKDVSYNGSAAGYASDPQEIINYAEAHDNQTFFDISALKLPRDTSPADRVRWQNIASSIVLLSQGVPFLHAGQELLRSKSLDHNSYNSGDWFNLLDYSKAQNGWGRGLPHRADNEAEWPVARDLLSDQRLHMGPADIARASDHVREMLHIRKSSPLFRLRSGAEVIENIRFDNVGPDQIPGLIVMRLGTARAEEMIVVINTAPQTQSVPVTGRYKLHDILRRSSDPVVRKARMKRGQLVTPPLTTAVFVKAR
ncbi:pullulanase-type alpha-1,6-glucosidase [Sphingorhabdus arenilitoris]|uniref:Pullulanase-type alpha-1,6-glucosidase n=1 Tax=Sphingorhabdus arenilitoris TaxID=1490041 RepID=A0ABV8RJ10_9SPHN